MSGVTRREEGAGGRSHMTTHLLLLLRLDLPPLAVCSSHVLFAFADVTRQKTDLIHRWQVLRVCFSLFYPASIRHKTTSLRAALSPHQLVFKQRALFVLNSPHPDNLCSNFNSLLQLGQSEKVTQTTIKCFQILDTVQTGSNPLCRPTSIAWMMSKDQTNLVKVNILVKEGCCDRPDDTVLCFRLCLNI